MFKADIFSSSVSSFFKAADPVGSEPAHVASQNGDYKCKSSLTVVHVDNIRFVFVITFFVNLRPQ